MLALLLTLPAQPLESDVVIRRRLTPTQAVETMAGKCGPHRYSVELEHDGDTAVLRLSVDGHPVAGDEIRKVRAAVRAGHFLYEPRIAECFWNRPNARFRILTGGPTDGAPAWISFEVSPNGRVSAIRPD